MRGYVLGLVAVVTSAPAGAYKIYAPTVHEAITLAAANCAEDALKRDSMPVDCSAYRSRVAQYSQLGRRLTELQRQVRWPDDPRREITSVGVARPFLNGYDKGCERKLRRSRAVQHIGTFCASHFGEWQFMHAMAVSRPSSSGGTEVDNATLTRAKMLEWAAFSYGVARGETELSQSYCTAFKRGGYIEGVMVPSGFEMCSGGNPWTVGTFFSVRCGQFLFFGWCRPLRLDNAFVRTVATGAILHMIQDSYSQSHVRRTDTVLASPRYPVVECGKPREYFVYNKANQKIHDGADQLPRWGESCTGRSDADDVITASAMALAMIDRGAPTPEFIRYLEDRVF